MRVENVKLHSQINPSCSPLDLLERQAEHSSSTRYYDYIVLY